MINLDMFNRHEREARYFVIIPFNLIIKNMDKIKGKLTRIV